MALGFPVADLPSREATAPTALVLENQEDI
jgi:hypothetical protein